MSPMPWFRLYSNDLLNDRKLARAARATRQPPIMIRGAWLTLLAMANDSPERGKLLIAEELPVTTDEMAEDMGIEPVALTEILDVFEKLDMVHWDDDCLVVTKFVERNPPSDSSTERVRKHRAKKRGCNVTVTDTKRSSNVIESERERESESESESEREGETLPPPSDPVKVYVNIMGISPCAEGIEEIRRRVQPEHTLLYAHSLRDWLANSWKRENIIGQLERYEREYLPNAPPEKPKPKVINLPEGFYEGKAAWQK